LPTFLEDYRLEADFEQKFNSNTGFPKLTKTYKSYRKLRGELIGKFKTDPMSFINIPRYCREVLPTVFPNTIFMSPTDLDTEHPRTRKVLSYSYTPQKKEGIFKKILNRVKWNSEPKTRSCVWAFVPKREAWSEISGSSEKIWFDEVDCWNTIATQFSPLIKLSENGRRHDFAYGPLMFFGESIFAGMGVNIEFEASYYQPDNLVMMAEELYEICGVETIPCDFCNKNITKPEGRIISPWLFRLNEKLAYITIKSSPLDQESMVWKLFKDWSINVACDRCHEALKFQECLTPDPMMDTRINRNFWNQMPL